MSAESIAEAFGRGLMQGMIGQAQPQAVAPTVIPVEAINAAVRQATHEILDPLLAEEQATPEAAQLDLWTHDIERVPADETADQMLRRLNEEKQAEAQMRAAQREAAAGREDERPTTYDPNAPNSGQPWMSAI